MKLNRVTDNWMETTSENEPGSTADEIISELNGIDYVLDEYLRLNLKRIDVVNSIASGFHLNLQSREHG